MDALVMALLAMTSVSLWTLRVALMGRGGRLLASVVAAIEALVYVTTFGRLLQDLTATGRLLGFAIGVATGTYLGMLVDERLARRREEWNAAAETGLRRGGRRWSRSSSRA
jgi:uncharacterized protein YebE (UPF0316 family)